MAVNKVILVGNVGADPEIRYLDNGTAVANLSLATSESYKNKNGDRITQTEWHRIVLWRGLAEISEKYVKKGMQLYIEGRLRTRSWDDKEGNKRYVTEIVADNMEMLSRKGEQQEQENSSTLKEPKQGVYNKPEEGFIANDADDDLPF